MTYLGPDLSQYQADIIPPEPHNVGFMICRASIGLYKDKAASMFIGYAKSRLIPTAMYHFVYPCDSIHTAALQAQTFHEAVGGEKRINCMLDWEQDMDDNCHPPGKIQSPTFDDVLKVAEEIRKLGHRVPLLYTSHGWWGEKGTPKLTGYGFDLVNAQWGKQPWPVGKQVETYNARGGDSGPGWIGYGGLDTTIWQYSCQTQWGNKRVDFNAYKGNIAEINRWFTMWRPEAEMTTFPYGYDGKMLTMEELEAKPTVAKLHPEFWRRFKALMEFAATQGVQLGVGTGWRIQLANPDGTALPGHALPGNSNHEGFPADGKSGGAVAIDAVDTPSFAWMEKNLAPYGLRSFNRPSTWGYSGSDEPWHVQPVEIPASRKWRSIPWVLPKWPLPPTKVTLATPSGTPSFTLGATDASTVIPGAAGGRVTWLQTILRDEYTPTLIPDGRFGPKSVAALKVMQTKLHVVSDGIYGNQTAAARYASVGK